MAFTKADPVVKKYSKTFVKEVPSNTTTPFKGHRDVKYPNGLKVRIKFAKKPFEKFPVIHDHVEYSTKGSSMNKEKLQDALDNDCDFIVVGYGDGSIYQYPADMYKEWAEEHDTIRTTQFQNEKERTYSIPLHIMQKIR